MEGRLKGAGSPVFEEGKLGSANVKGDKNKGVGRVKSPVFGSQNGMESVTVEEKQRTKGKDKEKAKGEKKSTHSKKKAKRKPVVIESSEDDDFEEDMSKKKVIKSPAQKILPGDEKGDDQQGKKKVNISPAQKVLSILGHANTNNDDGKSRGEEEDDKFESDLAEPMDTGEDTVPSTSGEDEPLSPTFEKVDLSQISNTSLGRNTLDGSKLSLTANLSNFFPNCSQVAPRVNTNQKPAKEEKKAVARTAIPPPPPSMSSLDLLDDLNSSLNTTVDLEFLAAPTLSTNRIKSATARVEKAVTEVEEEGLLHLLDEGVDPSEGKDAEVGRKQSASKMRKSDSFSRKLSTEKGHTKGDQLIANECSKSIKQTNIDSTLAGCDAVGPTKASSTEPNVGKDEGLIGDISFTLGDDLFDDDDDLDFGELPDEDGSKQNRVEAADLGCNNVKKSSDIPEFVEDCTIDPVPYEFQTPKMVNKTIAGIQTSNKTCSSLKNKHSSKSIDCEESMMSVPSTSNFATPRLDEKCVKPGKNICRDVKADVSDITSSSVKEGKSSVVKSEISDAEIMNLEDFPKDVEADVSNGVSSPGMDRKSSVVKSDISDSEIGNVYEAKENIGLSKVSPKAADSLSACDKNNQMNSVKSLSKAVKSDQNIGSSQTHSKDLGRASTATCAVPMDTTSTSSTDQDDELAIPQFDLCFDLEPQFDLDFDLDNLDESDLEGMDIVPPSPTAVRQQEYISQHPRGSFNHTSLRTFNTPSMLQFGKDLPDRPKSSTPFGKDPPERPKSSTPFGTDLPDRPSSSTPLHGNRSSSKLPAIETDFVSPITSRVQPNQSKVYTVDESNPSLLCPGGNDDLPKDHEDQRSSFCRIRPLFKSGGLSTIKETNVDVGSGKRKSSSPLAPSGLQENVSKRRKSVPEKSSLDVTDTMKPEDAIQTLEEVKFDFGLLEDVDIDYKESVAASDLQENVSKMGKFVPRKCFQDGKEKNSPDVKNAKPEESVKMAEEVQFDFGGLMEGMRDDQSIADDDFQDENNPQIPHSVTKGMFLAELNLYLIYWHRNPMLV